MMNMHLLFCCCMRWKRKKADVVVGLISVTDSGLYAGNCSGGACGVCAGQGSLHEGHTPADMARMVRPCHLLT